MKTIAARSLLIWGGMLCAQSTAYAVAQQQHPLSADADAGAEAGADAGSLRAAAPAYRDPLLALHKSLVSLSSISYHEQPAGTFLIDYLTSHGYTAEKQFLSAESGANSSALGRFNVLAWPGKSSSPHARVLVTSHIDVVPPYIPYHISATTPSDVGPDTLISGRGSVDAKGSVAAQITAVESLLSSESVSPDDIMLLFVVGEEVSGDGMTFFSSSAANTHSFSAAIFGEPTENKLACGHKGIAGGTIRAKGKAGHSGYPWLGKSATNVLVRALVKLLDADLGSSERYGNTTVNIGVIEGGVAANVIPKAASARFAVRVAAGNQSTGGAIVREKLETILKETDDEALSLEWGTGYGPVECDCDVEGFDTLVANYGTDVPHLEGDHVSYLYGPGTILVAHGDDEALRVSDLETAVEGYKTLIKHALQV